MDNEVLGMDNVVIYHGSSQIVERPEIRITKFNKDFYFGFYCTIMKEQATSKKATSR